MELKRLIALTYAITAGSLAISLTANYTQMVRNQYSKTTRPAPQTPQSPMTTVVTVAKPVPSGEKLTTDDFKQTNWPADAVPVKAYREVNDVFAGNASVYARTALFEGELMLPAKAKDTPNGSALSLLLPPNMRAVTVKVNEVRGVGGFIQPSDHVDILLTEKTTSQKAQPSGFTRVLLQNIQILAIGQDMKSDVTKPKVANSVTVAVSLQDAQKLALATTIGHLSLALRNPEQTVVSGPRGVSHSDLLPTKVARKPDMSKIVIIRSTKSSGYSVPLSGSASNN